MIVDTVTVTLVELLEIRILASPRLNPVRTKPCLRESEHRFGFPESAQPFYDAPVVTAVWG